MQTFREPGSGPAPLAGRAARHDLPGRPSPRWLLRIAVIAAAGWVGGTLGVAPALTAPALAADPTPSVTAQTQESAPAEQPVKYYIVGSTGTTEREYLFQIAAQTLGDGRRYGEIFALNQGRLQPDGQRLTDPLVLSPGWILILPADAEGPGVLFGPLPALTSSQGPAPSTQAPPNLNGPTRALILAGVAVVLLIGLYLLRPRRRTGPAQPTEPAKAAQPAQSAQPAQPTKPAHTAAPARPTHTAQPAGPVRAKTPVRAFAPVTPSEPFEPPEEPPGATQEGAPAAAREEATGAAHEESPNGRPEPLRQPVGVLPPDSRPGSGFESPWPPAAAPAISADPATARWETSLRAGRHVLTVSLVGARPDLGTGLRRGDTALRTTGGAVVRLGDAGPDAFWVDLAASPDLVTITGSRAGMRRQCEELSRQLSEAGVALATVGDVPGVTDKVGRAVASLRELNATASTQHLLVVFLHDVPAPDVAILHELIARRRPRVVPIAVGSGPRSRWWIDVV